MAQPYTCALLAGRLSRAQRGSNQHRPGRASDGHMIHRTALRCLPSAWTASPFGRCSHVGRRLAERRRDAGRLLTRAPCASSDGTAAQRTKRLVFLGTPEVAAEVLEQLLDAAAAPGASFEVAAVVSQPGRPKGRGNRTVPQPSPVTELALARAMPPERILLPIKASEEPFLAALQDLQPDLCVTAAYGNILPRRFLEVPRHGTLNIHPSLLPAFRGAAPVQRALEAGVGETGVTIARTVRALDAGPILAQRTLAVDATIQAPTLLRELFSIGTALLLEHLDQVWAGTAKLHPQDEALATHAAKLTKEEGELDFSQPALVLHNKVRAFAGWPGTSHTFMMSTPGGGAPVPFPIKVLRTRVGPGAIPAGATAGDMEVRVAGDCLAVQCGDGAVLEVLEVQPPGKRAMEAGAFVNGLKGRTLWRQ